MAIRFVVLHGLMQRWHAVILPVSALILRTAAAAATALTSAKCSSSRSSRIDERTERRHGTLTIKTTTSACSENLNFAASSGASAGEIMFESAFGAGARGSSSDGARGSSSDRWSHLLALQRFACGSVS